MWLALSTAMPTGKLNWPLPVRAGTMAVTSAGRPASAGTGARGADVSAGLEWIAHALQARESRGLGAPQAGAVSRGSSRPLLRACTPAAVDGPCVRAVEQGPL